MRSGQEDDKKPINSVVSTILTFAFPFYPPSLKSFACRMNPKEKLDIFFGFNTIETPFRNTEYQAGNAGAILSILFRRPKRS